MIEIKTIGEEEKEDVNIANEPFSILGCVKPRLENGVWGYEIDFDPPGNHLEMTFPDEKRDFDSDAGSVYIGAYENGRCIGLACLQQAPFAYIYLDDLKVNKAYRRMGIGALLIEKAKEEAMKNGYRGIYTIVQDNNVGAFLFYLKSGFAIGGFDNRVYSHGKQEGKGDIYLYLDLAK